MTKLYVTAYPLMATFIRTAFEANSGGGHLVDETEVIGTLEEWEKAEEWWQEFTEGMFGTEQALHEFIGMMGMKADEGYTMYQDYEGRTNQDISPPWLLLDRYY